MNREELQQRLTLIMSGEDVDAQGIAVNEILEDHDRIMSESAGFETAVNDLTNRYSALEGKYNDIKASYIARFMSPASEGAGEDDEPDPDAKVTFDSLFK